jgi:hypothetical protein
MSKTYRTEGPINRAVLSYKDSFFKVKTRKIEQDLRTVLKSPSAQQAAQEAEHA